MQVWLLVVLGGLLLAAHMSGEQQPLPYSHKTHVSAGLQCKTCHKNPDPGEQMGFPAESFCMGCHTAVKPESVHIQKLAAAAKAKQEIEWKRIYKLPKFVYFSHRDHLQAGATCERCHGPVRERDVITKEVVHNMQSCMSCHAETKAKNECDTCHEEK